MFLLRIKKSDLNSRTIGIVRVKRNKSIHKSKFSVGDEYTERNKKTKD